MKDLTIKEVNFQNNKIMAINENGKIYVSVSSVCDNLGMDKNLKDAQVKKIRNEGLLKGASKLTHLKTNGGVQETLVIELDYLPAWLFKINPSRFDEVLKERLMMYQLKAKDVLADAFFGKRETNKLSSDDWVFDRITGNVEKAKELESEIEKLINRLKPLYEEIAGIADLKKRMLEKTFFDFKTDKKKDTPKEILPSLPL